MNTTTSATEPVLDGRRARRERGRAAVIDGMIELYHEGHHPPSVEQIADRAGVSVASVYRYFESNDDLIETTLERFFETYLHLFDIPHLGRGTFDERVRRLVDARLQLFDTIAGPARMARLRAVEYPRVADRLAATRAHLAQQVRTQFAPELAHLRGVQRDDAVALVDALTSFESWDLLRSSHHRSTAQVRRAWVQGVSALVGSGTSAAT